MLCNSYLYSSDKDFCDALYTEHDWMFWVAPSVSFPRYHRWVGWFNDMLMGLLWDTVFFLVMYPVGVCEPLPTKDVCEAIPSTLVAGAQLCKWIKHEQTCVVGAPPGGFLLGCFCTVIIMVFSVPPSMLMWGLLSGVCVCRPDLDSIGIDANFWLGAPPGDRTMMMDPGESSYLSQVRFNLLCPHVALRTIQYFTMFPLLCSYLFNIFFSSLHFTSPHLTSPHLCFRSFEATRAMIKPSPRQRSTEHFSKRRRDW